MTETPEQLRAKSNIKLSEGFLRIAFISPYMWFFKPSTYDFSVFMTAIFMLSLIAAWMREKSIQALLELQKSTSNTQA